MDRDPVKQAIAAAGGTVRLARRLGISPQAVSQWRQVPAGRVIAVERASGGLVRREALRPDLYLGTAARGREK